LGQREVWCLAITGPPGAGKSTLARKVVEELKKAGLKVCGTSCPDVREGGRRVGFLIVDVEDGSRAWLARVDCEGPRVGRYKLCPGAEEVGVRALSKDCDVYLIDEIGPMELKLPKLREAMLRVVSGNKPFVAVYHARLRDEEFLRALSRCHKIFVTKDTREEAWKEALEALSSFSP